LVGLFDYGFKVCQLYLDFFIINSLSCQVMAATFDIGRSLVTVNALSITLIIRLQYSYSCFEEALVRC